MRLRYPSATTQGRAPLYWPDFERPLDAAFTERPVNISPSFYTWCSESCGAGPSPISMDNRSERHVTHPWLLAGQRPQLDLPPGAKAPSSSPRLALDAAFVESQAPASDSHPPASSVGLLELRTGTAMPPVLIKRKRTFAAPDAASASLAEFAHSDAGAEGDRAPRVFRVDTAPIPISTRTPKPTAPASAATAKPLDGPGPSGDGSGGDVRISAVPVLAARRPRRRAAPAVVTIVVSERQEAAAEHAATAGGSEQADELLDRLAALEATFSLIRDARDFRLVKRGEAMEARPDPGRYFALTAEIKRLQGVAEAARKAEASKAISWIRRAIETYALSRDDLGI